MSRIVLITLIAPTLSSCIAMVPVNLAQNNGSVEFHIEEEGLIFKTNRDVTYAVVYEPQGKNWREWKTMWRISAKVFEHDKSTYNLPKPGAIKYGLLPEGYVEAVKALPLEKGIEYEIHISGPGYGGGIKFVYSGNDSS